MGPRDSGKANVRRQEGGIRYSGGTGVCLAWLTLTACERRPEGWSEATHGEKASPNYDLVFPRGAGDHARHPDCATGLAGHVRRHDRDGRRVRTRRHRQPAVRTATAAAAATPARQRRTGLRGQSRGGRLHRGRRHGPLRRGGRRWTALVCSGAAERGGQANPGGLNEDAEFFPRTPIYVQSTVSFGGLSWSARGHTHERQLHAQQLVEPGRLQIALASRLRGVRRLPPRGQWAAIPWVQAAIAHEQFHGRDVPAGEARGRSVRGGGRTRWTVGLRSGLHRPGRGPAVLRALHDGRSSRSTDARSRLRRRQRESLQAPGAGRPLGDLRPRVVRQEDEQVEGGLERRGGGSPSLERQPCGPGVLARGPGSRLQRQMGSCAGWR